LVSFATRHNLSISTISNLQSPNLQKREHNACYRNVACKCAPGRREEWLKRDAEIWTPALAAHDGYISKEVWPSIDNPDDVVIIVRWESLAQWKSFPDELETSRSTPRCTDVQLAITSEALAIHGE
jgi:uncharacterized protein (TIGR03792 family)